MCVVLGGVSGVALAGLMNGEHGTLDVQHAPFALRSAMGGGWGTSFAEVVQGILFVVLLMLLVWEKSRHKQRITQLQNELSGALERAEFERREKLLLDEIVQRING
ncbi:MAG: hypothetical protein N3G20_10910, partial [Verrucomicrobiae bacterium]|nr:hypothetical protein [Verrucomicrobiae bacterium]